MAPLSPATSEKYASINLSYDAVKSKDKSQEAREKSWNLAKEVMLARVDTLASATCSSIDTAPFMVADMGEVYRQYQRWKVNLPRVKPYYAVKCNPETPVLRLASALGMGFDCASKWEIESVLDLGSGVEPSRIIFAHPRKDGTQARRAIERGVTQMTFDDVSELYKAKEEFPTAKLLLRIFTDDSASKVRVNEKFGAPLEETEELLGLARSLDLDVVGVSFHIGSDASNPEAFISAVKDARYVFDQAAELGYDMKILDVGGGFTNWVFEEMATALSIALDEYFPPSVRIIAEPGRFFVATAYTLATQVVGRRKVRKPRPHDPHYHIDINEGVYGSLANTVSDHQVKFPKILKKRDMSTHDVSYVVWGPTCDNFDKVQEHCTLPGLVDYGDWLYFEEMGAYTVPCDTGFNGFPKAKVIYVSSDPGASALLGWKPDFCDFM
ncbi:MAG: hypothetical protein Q9217_006656 [Psora testacea]